MDAQGVLDRVVTQVEDRTDALVRGAVDAIFAEVDAYARSADTSLRGELTTHVDGVFRTVTRCLREGRAATRDDFPNTEEQASRRLDAGIQLADFLHALRICQKVIWHGLLTAVPEDALARAVALGMVDDFMQVMEVASSVGAEGYLEARQYAFADQDRRVRDLMEDLLRRKHLDDPRKLAMLRSAGLGGEAQFLVLSAVLTSTGADPRDRHFGLRTARTARAHGVAGLAATRQDEVFGIVTIGAGGASDSVERLRRSLRDLGRGGPSHAAGLSTIHSNLAEVPDAYAEAVRARDSLKGQPGLVALTETPPLDYLVLAGDGTAQRLVSPAVTQFLDHDVAGGGPLIQTLEAYVACDFNAITTAQHLHLHVNTVYYRLARVAERTGVDLRSVLGVVNLIIAIRLHRAALRQTQ